MKFRKSPPRPVVCMPLATVFNNTVSMDLKCYKNIYFLVMVDLATRFCMASVIRDKKSATIVKNFTKSWIAVFGPPKKILTDNGKEFNNNELQQLGEAFNFKVMTTSAESAWSNGVCERLNAVLGNSVEKIILDTECDIETALAWAVSARNALSNFSGFSPNQMVFSHNPVLPNLALNDPPAFEKVTDSETVRNNLNAMHVARTEFIRQDVDEKLVRAMKHNIRATHNENLVNGDEVFYKRNESNEWKGPGIVIGRDGKQVLVKHGGTYVRVHTCRLRSTGTTHTESQDRQDRLQPEASGSNDIPQGEVNVNGNFSEEETDDEMNMVSESNRVPMSSSENDQSFQTKEIRTNNTATIDEASIAVPMLKPKVGMRFQCTDPGSGQEMSGKIISRAGKSTSKQHSNCFNFKNDTNGECSWLDFGKVDNLKVFSDDDERVVMFSSEEIFAAKEREINNWIENDVFTEEEDNGQDCISVRWVVTEKFKQGKLITKARLVARGFEENTLSIRKDSPTCSKEAVRLTISLATSYGWKINSVDVKAAYLQGDPINREVFLKPPVEFDEGKIWRLKKTVYGLCDAAGAWYNRVSSALCSLSVERCDLEPSLFYWLIGGELKGIICVYVDDLLWSGTNEFENEVIGKIRELFLIGSSETDTFKYIGLNLTSEGSKTTIDQNQYAASLSKAELQSSRATARSSELSDAEKREYRGLIGQLNWLATNSRPDISYRVCELAVSLKTARVKDLLDLNKIISWVKEQQFSIVFKQLDLENCVIECYSDASFANLPDSGSQGAFILFLCDPNGHQCPIQWQSRKIRRVVKSTLAAEALALLEGAEAAVYIGRVFWELTKKIAPIDCFVDNKSLCDAIYSSNAIEDRRLRIDVAVLRNMLGSKEIRKVSWVPSSEQLANCLTKRGASTQQLKAVLGGH